MSKWENVRAAFRRAHDDLEFDECVFYSYSESYDPATGDQSVVENQIGTAETEIIEGTPRSEKDVEGTDADVDKSFRIKETESFIGDITTYDDANERASEVETPMGKRYQIKNMVYENGSGFYLLEGVE